jgi:hypothetical protein
MLFTIQFVLTIMTLSRKKLGKKPGEKGKLAAKNFYHMATKTVIENTEHTMAAN